MPDVVHDFEKPGSRLADHSRSVGELLRKLATRTEFPKGSVLFREGDRCGSYVFVADGRVRVQMVSGSGRVIVLYRVQAGQSCVLTTASLMMGCNYAAEGIAETDVEVLTLKETEFRELLHRSGLFRDFVFHCYGARIIEILTLIDEVAFGQLERRLAGFLHQRVGADSRVRLTHQKIALELGTVREVVSRQLKDFERRALVSLHRGSVEVHDPDALGELASPS